MGLNRARIEERIRASEICEIVFIAYGIIFIVERFSLKDFDPESCNGANYGDNHSMESEKVKRCVGDL
jgi:hypothetical protein